MSQPQQPASHLRAVDIFRVVTVAGVISIHAVVFTTSPTSGLGSGLESLLHVNRELFLLLSAFVLTYAYHHRGSWGLGAFWRRRYWLVGVPYVTWTAIYSAVNGGPLSSWLSRFGSDLLTGAACYHLYFLLLTMQLYLIFPLLLRFVRATRGHHAYVLAASFAGQVALTTLFHYRLQGPGILSSWQHNPDALLLSFQFYVLAGAVAALHFERLSGWVANHARAVAMLVAGGVAVGITSFLVDLNVAGMSAAQASEVYQPALAVEAPVYALGLFALGQWLAARRSVAVRRVATFGADASFGIYLAHPLVLQGLLVLATATGALAGVASLGDPVIVVADLVVGVPLVYGLSALAVAGVRRTAFSLPFTGRGAMATGWQRALVASVRRPITQTAGDSNPA